MIESRIVSTEKNEAIYGRAHNKDSGIGGWRQLLSSI